MTFSDDSLSFSTHHTEEREDVLNRVLAQELGADTPLSNSDWAGSLYAELVSESALETYLQKSEVYEGRRWINIPEDPSHRSELNEPLCRVINSVVQHFGPRKKKASREAVSVSANSFKFEPIGSTKHSSSPDIVVKASGPSFSPPKGARLGFSNVAACIDTRLEEDANNVLNHLSEMAIYAKHMFIHQPNRLFVRSLLVTEKRARLFHFDRSGAQYSHLFDIHDKPHAFIRLILGLCTINERLLGLDDTIQWIKGPGGRRSRGTLRTIGPDNAIVTYDLDMDQIPFIRTNLCGRGTTCWIVKNANGQRLVVKDYWVVDNRPSEVGLLGEVKGLRGVCQMVSFEDNRARTKDFRGDTTAFKSDAFQNRTSVRIVMKAYSSSIENFRSVEQVLAALRDAIAAHKTLLSRNIIHRDISPNNILLSTYGADKGDRGVLIDLDIALKSKGPVSETPVDCRMGTRMFQSIMVLKSCQLTPDYLPEHDYLDDLESFFWLFTYILLTYTPNGHRMPSDDYRERLMSSWSHHDPTSALLSKWAFLNSPSAIRESQEAMHPSWRSACSTLFLEFREFAHEVSYEKERLIYEGQEVLGTAAPDRFSSLRSNVDEHYRRVIRMFDAALQNVPEVRVDESVPGPPPLNSSTSQFSSSDIVALDQ
ncbi:hypothetical protein EST38_g10920 [Candolleomyces aberdarensis]|uniref:Protein kinase domain-containing protein n=1 Tax=Candolleomyces aberdarensis TaxID=2316362 RepID=A0A4V1Q2F7_9AGAR|nr:hypothetical protein EST38_g10920 [Candolleomyces aberdarensis]